MNHELEKYDARTSITIPNPKHLLFFNLLLEC